MTADPLTETVSRAQLTFCQVNALQSAIAAAHAAVSAVREQSDFASDLWDDMSGLLDELTDVSASLIKAMVPASTRWVTP